jgi:hypothetical protein
MLARLQGRGTESLNDASLKRKENQLAIAKALGLDPTTLAALSGMRGGRTSIETERALAAQGFADVNPDGSVSLNSAGASLLRAANIGDVDGAEKAKAAADRAKAGKPGKGGSGGAPAKPTKEQIRTENRQKIGEALSSRIDAEMFVGLMNFADGQDLSPSRKTDLAQLGMLSIDEDGFARTTSAGKSFIAAAGKADLRGAKDALSLGAGTVRKEQMRANDLRKTANTYLSRADDATPKAEKKARTLQQKIGTAITTARKQHDRIDDQKEIALEQSQKYDAKADELDFRAEKALTDAANATDPDSVAELRKIGEALRTEATRQRNQARNAREDVLTYDHEQRDLLIATEQRVRDYELQIREAMTGAEETADEWRERAETLQNRADLLDASIGEANIPPTLLAKTWARLKSIVGAKEIVVPLGDPLPIWTEDVAPVSETDADAAIPGWKASPYLSDDAKDLLDARPATIVEIVEALSEGVRPQ